MRLLTQTREKIIFVNVSQIENLGAISQLYLDGMGLNSWLSQSFEKVVQCVPQ